MADAPILPPVGFAIIGTGMIAAHHARAIRAVPDALLVGVHSRDAAKRDAFAKERGIAAFATLAELLADARVQVVVVATPSGNHAEHAMAAAAAGKHVLCEKPLDITVPRASAIVAACAQHGVILLPVFQNRFGPAVLAIREALAAGRLGRVLTGRATMPWKRTQDYYRSGAWRGTWALDGGGCLMNQAIHTIDLLVHFLGQPLEVFGYTATLTHPGVEVEDTACAVLRFASGAMGVIEASTSCDPELPVTVAVTGSAGAVAVRGERLSQWEFAAPTAADTVLRAELVVPRADPEDVEARFPKHRAQVEDLIRAIRSGGQPSISPHDGVLAIEVITGIYESARTGKPYRFAGAAAAPASP